MVYWSHVTNYISHLPLWHFHPAQHQPHRHIPLPPFQSSSAVVEDSDCRKRKREVQRCILWWSGILYIDHPKGNFVFVFGLPGEKNKQLSVCPLAMLMNYPPGWLLTWDMESHLQMCQTGVEVRDTSCFRSVRNESWWRKWQIDQ